MQSSTVLFTTTRGGAFARLVAGWIDRLAERRQARRDIAMLSALDDRLLADIGFSRDQLGSADWIGRLPFRHFG